MKVLDKFEKERFFGEANVIVNFFALNFCLFSIVAAEVLWFKLMMGGVSIFLLWRLCR